MQENANLRIIEEPNIIDDHLLDIIGNEFKFDHEKGLAEWLKNSVDAYIRSEVPDSAQNVIFRFFDGNNDDAIFECIDFVGMTEAEIDKAFKRWGDPEAAKRGLGKKTYGGHGNGGKFYMRQMFRYSHFVTYKDNKISIFGFNNNRKYGFADGYKSKKVKPTEALEIAKIDKLIFPKGTKDNILSGKSGFTVVRGVGPAKMKNAIKFDRLIDKLKNHPQARRILDRINVLAAHNSFPNFILLKPDEIKPFPGFETPKVIVIPKILEIHDGGEQVQVEMTNKKYSPGKLILKTSAEAFGKGSRSADLNRIDIVGEIGVIASYQLYELGVTSFPQASFLYGECECPILEDPETDAVKNDRTKLVDMPRSNALLSWLREQADNYANEIAAIERREQEEQRKKISAAYNDYLNQWKDRFMAKFIGDLFHGAGDNSGGDTGAGKLKKILEAPDNGFSFSIHEAEIACGREERITLKAQVPEPIPLGSIINLESTVEDIELGEKKITVRSNTIKTAIGGEQVSVMNVVVIGRTVGVEGKLVATAGKLKAEIVLRVVEPSGLDKSKKSKTPQVLLSGIHPDPLKLAPGGTVTLTDRDPLVYQRYQDVKESIYWINTQSPLADGILRKYNDSSVRWRDYLFQRYVDIFTKQALYELQKRDPDGFRAERIDSEILDGMTRKVHAAALEDLGKFFFDEEFEPTAKDYDKQ
jgi:hypothetical protein